MSALTPKDIRFVSGNTFVAGVSGHWALYSGCRTATELEEASDTPILSSEAYAKIVAGDSDAASEALARRYAHLGGGLSHIHIYLPPHKGLVEPSEVRKNAFRFLDVAFMSHASELIISVHVGVAQSPPISAQELFAYASEKNALAKKNLTFQRYQSGLAGPDENVPDGATTIQRCLWLERGQTVSTEDLAQWTPEDWASIPAPLTQEDIDSQAAILFASEVGRVEVRPSLFPTGQDLASELRLYNALLDLALASDVVMVDAARVLSRLLHGIEPSAAGERNPSSSGTSTLVLGEDGTVFPSIEAKRVADEGDEAFAMGPVTELGYHDLTEHPLSRTLLLASSLAALPGWNLSPYRHYLTRDPVASYVQQGSVHGRMKESQRASRDHLILDSLLTRLQDPAQETGLRAWASLRPFGESP